MERIILTGLELDQDSIHISNITVKNLGAIESKIRAIYVSNSTKTTFICDPIKDLGATTYIAPHESININIPNGVVFEPESRITAATERGVKTTEYEYLLYFKPEKPPSEYDPSKLYIGPLMLKFDAFWYRRTEQDGSYKPGSEWKDGWSIPKTAKNCAWNITVKNIDDRNITLNRFSSFVAVPVDSPSNVRPWYIDTSDNPEHTQFLAVNQTDFIIYIWETPHQVKAQAIYSVECRCMVFLTFFGHFHEDDGTKTSYAQTIPFEASITVISK
jgi:hypothetical protein